jgi:tRNA1Val (adenine37-N6)-methyltransferase
MKVCTDACLFGAIVSNAKTDYKSALDIGTGTGLLSLMYAQKNLESVIDAVEINENSYQQAKDNFNESLFKHQINIYLEDIRTYHINSTNKYDIIFSNPPFYPNNLKSIDDKRNIAMHSSLLSYNELFEIVNHLLNDDGKFFILIPYSLEGIVLEISKEFKLYSDQVIRIKQTYNHNYFRSVIEFSKFKKACTKSEISIKDNANEYTTEFKNLLQDYYLNF